MKKLNLDVDALKVDRFEVEPAAVAGDGTVVANQLPPTFRTCGPDTCYPQESCITGDPCQRC